MRVVIHMLEQTNQDICGSPQEKWQVRYLEYMLGQDYHLKRGWVWKIQDWRLLLDAHVEISCSTV
jgi:hypothetical protein